MLESARSIEEEVEALMPDAGLCHERSLEQVSHSRTHAYEFLGEICRELKNLITDGKPQSFASIRSELVRIQEQHVPYTDKELIDNMDRLLFREPRRRSHHVLSKQQERLKPNGIRS